MPKHVFRRWSHNVGVSFKHAKCVSKEKIAKCIGIDLSTNDSVDNTNAKFLFGTLLTKIKRILYRISNEHQGQKTLVLILHRNGFVN